MTDASSSEFRPPRWLASPHVQSLLASTRFRRALVDVADLQATSERWIVDCGDGVRLLALRSRQPASTPDTPVVVLIHGWEGSADSTYLMSAGAALYRRGADVVRLNLRDHGDTHHLNEELFHSCRLDEAIGAVRAIAGAHPGQPVHLVGWSLGGNFAVRIAHRAQDAGVRLAQTIAVSPVVDPANSYHAMATGLVFYRRYFLQKWRRSLRRKQAAFPGRYEFGEVLRMTDLHEMTAHLVGMFGEFESVDHYFRGYTLTREMLEGASTPLTVIAAGDDPVIPGRDFAPFRSGGRFRLELHPHGGHCGFMDRLAAHSWVDARLCRMIAG